jgi:hypothetical protein
MGAKAGVKGGPTMVRPSTATRAYCYRRRCCCFASPPQLERGGGLLAQGLIGLIEYSYHQGIPSFLEAHLQRTLGLSVLDLEQF